MSEFIFKLPDLGEGTVESEIGEWFIKVGDIVKEEDLVGTMMTDKAAVELSSPVTGRVIKLAGEPGDIVAVGAPLVIVETETEVETPAANGAATDVPVTAAPDSQVAVSAPEPVAASPAHEEPTERSRVITSPAIRRRARAAGIDLTQVPGSGPGGRILRSDFENYEQSAGTPATAAIRSTNTREFRVIGLRRLIVKRMSTAKREI